MNKSNVKIKKRHFLKKIYIKKVVNNKKISYCFFFRPFIKFSRFELLKFCEFWNFPIYSDSSNFNINLKRNRLRLEFFPYLKFFFNIKIFEKINQFLQIINFENKYFTLITNKIIFSFFVKKKSYYIFKKTFFFLPKIIQYRIIHYFYYSLRKRISFNEIIIFVEKFLNIKKE